MKRFLLILASLLLLLCSCAKEQPVQSLITADMLNITNTEKSFEGCLERYGSVISAMKTKVSVLENEHNNVIKSNNQSEYFLEPDYILTAFEPFNLGTIYIAENFTRDLDNEQAQTVFKLESGGMDIIYKSEGDNKYELRLVSEELVKEYTAEFDKQTDSFRYVFTAQDGSGERIEELLEFTKTESGAYVIQSGNARCYIEFNEKGETVYFCYGELRNGHFLDAESIYALTDETLDRYWVLSTGKANFANVHTFEDGILTHEDCSSGPWKSIKIDSRDFASAFFRYSGA